MKLASVPLELRILKTLTASKKKQLAKLVQVLNPACFESNVGKEIYQRVMSLAQQRGLIIGWDELQVDPALAEGTRKSITKYKKRAITDPDKLNRSINLLQHYRKLRAIYYTTEQMIKVVNSDKVPDVDRIIQNAVASLNDAQVNKSAETEFFDIGGGSSAKARRQIRKLLAANNSSYIPTGLREFDGRNRGIPRGTFFVVQTNSGGGKSVMANQLVSNMAMNGFRVCLVPLEMSGEENLKRHIARQTNTPMGKVINPKKLQKSEYKGIVKSWLKYHEQIRKAKGLLRVYVPKEDMTMEEILFTLLPHKFDVIIVDYIGLLKGTDGDDQAKRLGAAGRFAKRFADIHNCCIGVCAQLSDDNKVKYSRAINEHSGLSFSWQYDKKAKESHLVLVELPKARNQDDRPFYLKENFEYMRFEDIDNETAKRLQDENKNSAEKSSVKTGDKRTPKNIKEAHQERQERKKERLQKEKRQKIVSEADFFN